MKRRRFMQAFVAAPAVPGLLAQQPAAPQAPSPAQERARSMEEAPKLDVSVADAAADPMPHFFNAAQFTALTRLCDVLVPPQNGNAGALTARAPEFLDFLISESPADRQQLYRAGLDALNSSAKKHFGKTFAETDNSQATTVLSPLHDAWTYEAPSDPLARFLIAAKQDVRTATMNSREYNVATPGSSSGGGRRFTGSGLYWYPLD